MRRRIEAVGEEVDDAVTAELARGKRNIVDNQERYALARRPRITVGRSELQRRGYVSRAVDVQATRGNGVLPARS
jgi:hypothetical protein